ncbi:putative MFS hexose transporter [Aureobasidium pullulans]|uniref:MFS hexose transporter n=1 Tax=Aureobasidium pullulans TaxID=5580 RepID=A0AB74IQR5_AURPU|nr:putative MFS hexose transporter [Aureobasidium pullulans]
MAPTAAKTTNDISSSIDLSSIAPFYKRKNGILLYLLLTTSLLSSFASGFDGTNAMQLLPIWQEKFGNPTGSTLGLFGASTSIGGLVPLIFFNWMGDYFGRRVPTAVGALIIIVGALVELFSSTLSMFIGGKVVIGLGSTMVQLGAPVLVTELTHPKERAKVTTVYNTGVYLGYVIGAWVTFGCIKINTDWQWKLPTLLQVIPSVYQLTLLWFCPESPRWLIAKGKEDQARAILVKYHGECDPNSELILKDTGLDSTFDSTLINGMSTLWSYICSLAVAGFVDRFNRRTFFLTGSIGSLVVFVAWTIAAQQYVDEGSIAAGRFIVACIFLFQAFYTIGWLNFVVTYPLEIVTYQMRAKAWSYVLLVIQASQIFGNYVNPVALENIGWHWYIYYCVWIACIVAIVYFFFVETRGPTLEEIAVIFDGPNAYPSAEKHSFLNGTEKATHLELSHVEKV